MGRTAGRFGTEPQRPGPRWLILLICTLAFLGTAAIALLAFERLPHLEDEVACDVIVSGAKAPRERVMELCKLVPGLRAINGGPLANARFVEAWTALLIGLNVRYKVPEGLGFRLTGLPD